ncbi:MAG: sensor histidine kinase [Cellulosilyticaceae bacterium]
MNSLSRKIFLISKLMACVIILIYVGMVQMSVDVHKYIIWWILCIVAIISGFYLLLTRMITRPIERINETAKAIAELDFSQTLTLESNDELGELVRSLNSMSDKLQKNLGELEITNQRLEQEIAHERQVYQKCQELFEQLSHEMKTPLMVVEAYAEGIRGEYDDKKRDEYTDIIIGETNKINNKIIGLLEISALETGVTSLVMEVFDIVELVEVVGGRLLVDLLDVKFELTYNLPNEEIWVRADKQQIIEVLENYMTNAQKFVEEGGEINISLDVKADEVKVSIYNQGELLSEEMKAHIWEKFYRSPLSKSKGGSGLGLALVSQILNLHEMKYGVYNREEGVVFYFIMPRMR